MTPPDGSRRPLHSAPPGERHRGEPVAGHWYHHRRFSDPHSFERWSALHGWSVDILHLGQTAFSAHVRAGTVGSIAVERYRLHGALTLTGQMRFPVFTIAIALSSEHAAVWHDHRLGPDQAIILPPGVETELYAPRGLDLAVCYLSERRVRRMFASHVGRDVGRLSPTHRHVTPAPECYRAVHEMYTAELCSQRANARGVDALETILLSAFSETLSSTCSPACMSAGDDDLKLRYVRRACRYIDANFKDPLKVDDLALAVGVSSRLLQLCFREVLQSTPMRYLRARRLCAAHEALRGVASEGSNVTDIAHACGFSHLGRFSAYYRAVYGELPKITLSDRARRPSPAAHEQGRPMWRAPTRAESGLRQRQRPD